jgi:hypothetical protein
MRVDLNDENTKKAQTAERQLLEQQGVVISPTQIINILLSAVDQIELQQVITVTLKSGPPATGQSAPPKKKLIRKASNWVLGFK